MTPDIRSAGTISKRNSLIEQPDQTRLDSLCGIIGQLLILVDFFFSLTVTPIGFGNAVEG